ncbi:DUF2637 domain-containing protein [Streptomyces sp. NPDC050658]|uniref:DUF2637 domain-containing protein n=1 Tax=unclassified Streptomyces TaxID=2593676 RepID=UPI00342A7E60
MDSTANLRGISHEIDIEAKWDLFPPPTPGRQREPAHRRHASPVPPPRPRKRRHRARKASGRWSRFASRGVTTLTVVMVLCVVSLGGLISYKTLHVLGTSDLPQGVAHWWPLLIYGPWIVACLTILRSALHGRGTRGSSWTIMIFFSLINATLCAVNAIGDAVTTTVAGLPPIAALACLHQLVDQLGHKSGQIPDSQST